MRLFRVRQNVNAQKMFYDRSLLWTVMGLVAIGLIMVTSASLSIKETQPLFYTQRELIQLGLSLLLIVIVLYIPTFRWQQASVGLLFISIGMLIIVLFIGSSVKGAARWIPLGIFNFQPAELSKLALFCYLASYLSRKTNEVQSSFWGFFKPMTIMLVLSILLLKQPDLGTVIVLSLIHI